MARGGWQRGQDAALDSQRCKEPPYLSPSGTKHTSGQSNPSFLDAQILPFPPEDAGVAPGRRLGRGDAQAEDVLFNELWPLEGLQPRWPFPRRIKER